MDSNTHDPPIQGYPLVSQPKGYALSGKIMLSAIIILFGVVVIMVCFHIYARWYILRARRRNVRRARRRTHLVFYIDPNHMSDAASPTTTRGLDAAVVNSLPTFVYDGDNITRKDDDVEVLECAVCLSEFEVNEKGRMLPKCNHCFHVECIDMWFHSHDTCPLCRAPVEVGPQPGTGTEPESEPGSIVVEMDELSPSRTSQLGESDELGVDVGPSSNSVGSRRRKGLDLVGVTIEVPRRCQSFSFMNTDESGSGSGSGSGRVRSFKRFLSRERKSPLPSPSGSSRVELDIESGRVDPTTPRDK